MPQDYYSDNPGDTEDSTTASPDTATESPDRENADESNGEEEFLVSKSALGGRDVKPGDRCTFECVENYEDENSFRYVKDGDKSDTRNPDMEAANKDMESMAEE